MTWRLTPAEEEYLRMFCLTPLTMCDTPHVPHPPFLAASQLQPMYVPTWPTAQFGPPPPMPQAQPAPKPVPPATPPAAMHTPPVAPPLQHFSYPPGVWGLMPHYYQAPSQPYLISYPPGP